MLEPPPPPAAAATTGGSSKDRRQQQLKSTPVNPSQPQMACVFPRSHGGDAGGSPPRRPNRPVPAQCESSNLRIETGNASLRRAFRQNDQRPLTIGFDYGDLVVMLGLLAIETEVPLAHKNKQTVYKADHFTRYGSAEEARKRKCGETEPKMSGITCSMQVQELPVGLNLPAGTVLWHFQMLIRREELDRIIEANDQEGRVVKEANAEAQQRAYVAALKADAGTKIVRRMYEL
ncbi:hypothetical protein Tco_1260342 [Tanacetum coccineum]